MTRAFIGLGANLGDRRTTVARALDLLADAELDVLAVSTLRETDPVGYAEQPRFLNGAALVETDLEPRALLDRLLAVERELGRVRADGPRYGPRSIDLDLLLYGDRRVSEPGLEVPHPRLHERRFALEPVAELDPNAVIPGRGSVSEVLAELD